MTAAVQPSSKAGRPKSRELNVSVWYCLALACSLVLRWSVLTFESNDYRSILSDWYDYIVEHGRWACLKDDFSCYSSLYLAGLSLCTLLPLPKLFAVKLYSIVFDYIASALVFKIVRLKYPEGKMPHMASIAVLFVPTVWMNSAVWGQYDAMYTAALLAVLLCTMIGKSGAALALYGVACGLKPQAIFLAPFLAGLFLKGLLPWKYFFIPPAVYGLCGLPEILAGKPIWQVLFHWARQKNAPGLKLGATNWYLWTWSENETTLYWAGIGLTVAASAAFVLAMQRDSNLERKTWLVSTGFLSVLLVPYFLPGMHERYFFAADLFSLVYACFVPRGWLLTLWVQTASFFTYLPYLFDQEPIPRPLLSILTTAALVTLALRFGKSCWRFETDIQRKEN